jgi:DNA-binding transcriptional regulator YiaG
MIGTQPLTFDGERVKRIRIHYGETQREFAVRMGVNVSTVAAWETGVQRPKAAQVVKRLLAAEREALGA